MAITVNQEPRPMTPTGAEHVYSVSSTASTSDNFKYIFDVYVDPNEAWVEKVVRLKVRPNQYGEAIINLEEIVRSLVKPNIMGSEGSVWKDNINDISAQIEEMSVIPRLVTSFSQSNAKTIYEGTTPAGTADYRDFEPEFHIRQYRVLIGEEYTNRLTGQEVLDISEDPTTANTEDPEAVLIWPAVDNDIMATRRGTDLMNNYLYDYQQFQYFTVNPDYTIYPSRIPLIGSRSNKYLATSDELKYVDKTIYRNQPLFLPFFQGEIGDFTNEVRHIGILREIASGAQVVTNIPNVSTIHNGVLVNVTDPFPPLEVNEKLSYIGLNQEWSIQPNLTRIEAWVSTSPTRPDLTDKQISSEVIRYNIKETNCFQDEPVYLVYLNSFGVWDSITFGAVDMETTVKDVKTYSKAKFKGGINYVRFVDRATQAYDAGAMVEVEAQSDFVTNEEALQYVDCISSQYIFLARGWNTGKDGKTNFDLIPVTLTSNTVQHKKGFYEKLKKYTINFTLDNIWKKRIVL